MSTTNATDDLAFRRMLVQLSENITEDELQTVKFLCTEKIPRRHLEAVTTPLKLWEALGERNLIGPANLDFFKSISTIVRRNDLLEIVSRYERDHVVSQVDPSNRQETLTDMSEEFDLISSVIGRDWRRLVRKLGISDADIDTVSEQYHRDVQEQTRQLLVLWQKRRGCDASRGELVGALHRCQYNALATKLEQF